MIAPPPMNTLLALATVQNSMGMPHWSMRVDESEYPSPTPQNSPIGTSSPFSPFSGRPPQLHITPMQPSSEASSPTDSQRTVRKKKSSFDLRDEFQHGAREEARARVNAASHA